MADSIPFVFFSLLFVLANVNGLKWKVCDGVATKSEVKRIVIPGCETTDICVLTRGHNASFEIDFIPSEAVSSATAVVHGIIDHIPIPFGIDNPNACIKSGLTCPLEAGKLYQYTTSLYIKEQYPAIRLIVKWELQDSASKDVLCIMLGAELR